MIDQLKDLKDTYESARSQIDRGKEPLEDLLKLQSFLAAIHEDPKAFLDKEDKEFKRYFFDDFTMGMLKRLTRERSRDDKYLDVIKNILENYMLIFIDFLKQGAYNQQFFDGIKFLFEYDSILHNYNYQIPEEELKTLRSANQEWRKLLKEGDMVDAIADENNVRCSGWSQARISSVNTDVLQLEFIYDTKGVDRYLDRWSVEIAPFETKTKDLWEWKQTLAVGSLIDANDKSVWNKSTILDIKEQQINPDRIIKMAFVGYRVYVETGNKQDEKGTFEGWSSKFDEWISLYSPRVQPFHSKTQKGMQDDLDLDEDLDALLVPEQGFSKVYAVPRIRKCISSVFLHLINLFGNSGGFELILTLLSKAQSDQENDDSKEQNAEGLNLNFLATIIQCISYPFLVYHREFILEYGPRLIDLCIKALKNAPEKSLRDVRREKIESIIKSIDNFQRRLVTKDEREKQTEMLKLEVSLMCLKSSFLERRIHGIRDLNAIIKNLRMFSVGNKAFTNQILIEWLQNNGVFNILFDTKKTHLQLVQRCTDIIKLLLQENMLNHQLMEMFWSLARSDYKFEVYKIINECSFYFKQDHIDFFFEQIKQIPSEKLAIEEFQCLSELGKYTRDEEFRQNVSTFFWNIICNSDNVKEDLVNSCINKFCEMVKSWDLSRKYTFFEQLTVNLSENKSSIPSIRLFKGMIKDQKEKSTYNYNSTSPQRYPASSGGNIQDQSSGAQTNIISQELTISNSLNKLIQENNLIQILMDNLKFYCKLALAKSTEHTKQEPRKKLFLVNPKYSHHEEIDERLQFLKYVAQVASDYQVSKLELGVIYDLLSRKDLLVSSSDPEEFLTWCKSSCEQSTSYSQILDLNEVGQFFTEKMNSGELDVKNLLVVGFDFLQQYFLSLNENQQKIMKIQPKQSKQKYNNYGGYTSITYGYNAQGQYGPKNIYSSGKKQEDEEPQQSFKLVKTPSELDQLDIVWNMALQCENPKVVPKAIDFLIKVYYSLDSDIETQKLEIQEALIDRCMSIIHTSQDQSIIVRVIEIIKNIIYETEKKGTGDVKPHNALLKGELLENITIRNRASPKNKNIIMKIYSNATVWEFKKVVAKQLDLAPKYLKLELQNGSTVIRDSENGKTLAQLGLQSNDFLSAYKITVEEEVPNAPLIGPDQKLTEKAKQIFNEWFDMYSDENRQMTKETCSLFIKGCTGEQPAPNDDRIQNLFKQYDINNDGKIERQEFLIFYETAAKGKSDTVRENLRSHNIRNDLKKLSEIQEESSYQTEDMPRFKISKNQTQFDLLISLLDRQDEASQASWDLIQMLATNQDLYKRVLQLKTALDPQTGKIDWTKFFDNQSVYKLLYTLQIVEAVMEEGEGEGLESVVIVNEDDNKKKASNAPNAPPFTGPLPPGVSSQDELKPEPEVQKEASQQEPALPSFIKRSSTVVENSEEDHKLRSEWTSMFLQHNGFQYILQVFMNKEIQEQDKTDKHTNQQFELKHIAFLLKLLRIFIMAAFSTSADSTVFDSVNLIRRSSNVDEELQQQPQPSSENSRFKELQKQLTGPIGEQIIQGIDYKLLQQKILTLINQILNSRKDKGSMTFEDKLIIENALSLWVGCALHKNELLNDFYAFQSDEFILSGLLYCEQEKVREEFKLSLSQLAQKLLRTDLVKEIPLFYLLRLLSEKFSLISQYHCKQYFELFCELIDHYFNLKNRGALGEGKEVFNPEILLGLIIDKIKDFNQISAQAPTDQKALTNGTDDSNSAAANAGVSEQEEIYIGLIQLTGKIIDNFDISFSEKIVEQKNLIDEIFVQFLFASVFKQDSKNVLDNLKIKPKSRSESSKKTTFGKKSKDAAYRLLNSLIRKSPLLMNSFLEKSMLPLTNLIKRHDGWNYSPSVSSEKSQKYVGLRNLGCICYMNSMLQQFFMIPAFRYNLLCVDDKLPEDLQEYKGLKIDDNVLHQLQKLMAHLELSERTEYIPVEFCFSFKDLDGNPTNTGEQKDAQEFLNLSFDRIENLLRSTTRKYLLQSVFGGQTCSQFVCLECGKVKNRIEDFYNLSLTVKDIKSLYDSLQKQIEGEVINDYECDQCKKKVDISKRNLISLAPNVLIVHLQRITFNFETFRNDKINSFFEFPFLLDLKPYSFYEVMKKEGRLKKQGGDDNEEAEQNEQQKEEKDEENPWPEEETCYEYKLVGVNVHSGTANAGHYWSFINTCRGVTEPDENDPNWVKTENDAWMKFNDSQVSEYNIEKLKEDCYGGDGKSGGSDGDSWSFGGSYGQSAYMLVYEKRQKRPIKVLATPEEIAVNKDKLLYDEKKEEHYKLIDYREGVEDITPNDIYKQVFEDNYKFEFENDIYSNEFFEFVRSIIVAVSGLDKDRKHQGNADLESAKANTITVGKKVILDLLAKCFHNTSIRSLVESLTDVMNKDDNLCIQFLDQCFKEDNCNYLFEILLECTDTTSRLHVGNLVRYIINKLKVIEKDRLYEMETFEYETPQGLVKEERHVALSARFIAKALSLLNTQVARSWSRFDYFLDIIYSFAVGSSSDPLIQQKGQQIEQQQQEEQIANPDEEIGLEFLFRNSFIEKACDFILGKKSPMLQAGEKRYEMGGSYNSPNFGSITRLITKMLTHQTLMEKYPLSDLGKKMFLHQDLLKVMLGAQASAKPFGLCLANMCRGNRNLSRKVSKVFVKAINGSSPDTLKAYLKALKPFLKVDDDFKYLKLEWIFGFAQINQKKQYNQEKYKYGVEMVDRINEEAYTYMTPLSSGPNEDSLFSQLLKCKGKQDTNCILCLQEMLNLMSKDDEIARFVYNTQPPTYQYSRYTDWIRIYLENQRQETERSASYNAYFKNKFDSILKSLVYLEKFEERTIAFQAEERAAYEKARTEDGKDFAEVEKDWLAYQNPDVIEHFPPQFIIGRQVADDREFLVNDEDPNVKVSIYEVACEYNYSNPTKFFNISLPHIEAKTTMYQTMSYLQYKRMQLENERRRLLEEQQQEDNNESTANTDNGSEKDKVVDPQDQGKDSIPIQAEEQVKVDDIQVVNWFQNLKSTPPVLLKVLVTNKTRQKMTVKVTFRGDNSTNAYLPRSDVKELFFDNDTRCLINLQKIDPSKPWGEIYISVESKVDENQGAYAPSSSGGRGSSVPSINITNIGVGIGVGIGFSGGNETFVACWNCKKLNDFGMDYCEKCGESLNDTGVSIMENYFTGVDQDTNFMS